MARLATFVIFLCFTTTKLINCEDVEVEVEDSDQSEPEDINEIYKKALEFAETLASDAKDRDKKMDVQIEQFKAGKKIFSKSIKICDKIHKTLASDIKLAYYGNSKDSESSSDFDKFLKEKDKILKNLENDEKEMGKNLDSLETFTTELQQLRKYVGEEMKKNIAELDKHIEKIRNFANFESERDKRKRGKKDFDEKAEKLKKIENIKEECGKDDQSIKDKFTKIEEGLVKMNKKGAKCQKHLKLCVEIKALIKMVKTDADYKMISFSINSLVKEPEKEEKKTKEPGEKKKQEKSGKKPKVVKTEL